MLRRPAWQKVAALVPEQQLPPELEPYRTKLPLISERQRECMRLVAENFTSKKIGKLLGISAWSVDKHIIKARRHLGDMDRYDAARIIRAYEAVLAGAPPPPQDLGTQSLGLLPSPKIVPSDPVDNDAEQQATPDREMALSQGETTLMNLIHTLLGLVPLRSSRRQSNDLTIYYILIAVAVVSSLALFSAGSAASFLSALDSLARR
ncbi:LuxR C-terminal-related transcriptional regulator (plasmid) [Sphingobium sp. V4]|uniref:LuxR C-terminal-related transcriptional regulator n=1 Tax=Sphingobium sp. V4 TaxID=3038927 RepID=UPI0025580AEE|nr:LuxR C-terminal-related transcriptional regulator [Sphingobium sp. V4]WIW91088.1 LuxR C-terminal-related transcriptional regulator [Sphingobium sp. V4]